MPVNEDTYLYVSFILSTVFWVQMHLRLFQGQWQSPTSYTASLQRPFWTQREPAQPHWMQPGSVESISEASLSQWGAESLRCPSSPMYPKVSQRLSRGTEPSWWQQSLTYPCAVCYFLPFLPYFSTPSLGLSRITSQVNHLQPMPRFRNWEPKL